jgi:hypothetical protein
MEQETLEGRWEDILLHASQLAGKRVRVTVIEGKGPTRPNEAMIAALDRVRERARQTQPSGSTEESLRILREGRAGKMFGHDSSE